MPFSLAEARDAGRPAATAVAKRQGSYSRGCKAPSAGGISLVYKLMSMWNLAVVESVTSSHKCVGAACFCKAPPDAAWTTTGR